MRCCEKEKQILCSCVVSILPTRARKKCSHVQNVRLGDSQTSRGMDRGEGGACVCVHARTISRKLPFLVWKSRGLWRRVMLQWLSPPPFLKPGAFPDTSCTTTAQRFFLSPPLAWPPPSSPATAGWRQEVEQGGSNSFPPTTEAQSEAAFLGQSLWQVNFFVSISGSKITLVSSRVQSWWAFWLYC